MEVLFGILEGYRMKTSIVVQIGFLACIWAVSGAVSAGEAVMTWQNPDKFTDIRPGNGTDQSYRKGIQRAFTRELTALARSLPNGQRLEIHFTDIDLAGEVDPIEVPGGYQIRFLKDVYFPRLVFDYRLLDATEHVLSEQQGVVLRDMSYLSRARGANTNSDFYYETQMLREWFNKTLAAPPRP